MVIEMIMKNDDADNNKQWPNGKSEALPIKLYSSDPSRVHEVNQRSDQGDYLC